VLTVYGIETALISNVVIVNPKQLQQCLPFTVLKRKVASGVITARAVATVLTVYGIETRNVYQ